MRSHNPYRTGIEMILDDARIATASRNYARFCAPSRALLAGTAGPTFGGAAATNRCGVDYRLRFFRRTEKELEIALADAG